MKILVSGNSTVMSGLVRTPLARYLGILAIPKHAEEISRAMRWGVPVAADNLAFSNAECPGLWNLLVDGWIVGGLDWLAVPDVPFDAAGTLERWHDTLGEIDAEIGERPVPFAFVLQDGIETMPASIPWDDLAAVFVGGSTEWKLSPEAARLCREARRRGKSVHVGRVNSMRRLAWARDAMQADSVDGTGYSRFGREKLVPALEYLALSAAYPDLDRYAPGRIAGLPVPADLAARKTARG